MDRNLLMNSHCQHANLIFKFHKFFCYPTVLLLHFCGIFLLSVSILDSQNKFAFFCLGEISSAGLRMDWMDQRQREGGKNGTIKSEEERRKWELEMWGCEEGVGWSMLLLMGLMVVTASLW
jgi:hypothetical protein